MGATVSQKRSAGVRTGVHPILRLFWGRGWGEGAGMDWLQGNGWVSDLCGRVWDIAPTDAVRVLTAARAAGLPVDPAEGAIIWRPYRWASCQCGMTACVKKWAGDPEHKITHQGEGVPWLLAVGVAESEQRRFAQAKAGQDSQD